MTCDAQPAIANRRFQAVPHTIVATIEARDESNKFRCKVNLTSASPQGFLIFPFQDWHGIVRKLATADRHTICIVRRRSR
jgi:hypothetical protein